MSLRTFQQLWRAHGPFDAVIWDVDGTLGVLPGWSGIEPVAEYCTDAESLQALVWWAKQQGTHNVIVSRNGMFCELDNDRPHHRTVAQFRTLGFDAVGGCYAERPSVAKVMELLDRFHAHTILLIDDQEQECAEAVAHGAYAIQVHAPVIDALRSGQFTMHTPKRRKPEPTPAPVSRGLRRASVRRASPTPTTPLIPKRRSTRRQPAYGVRVSSVW